MISFIGAILCACRRVAIVGQCVYLSPFDIMKIAATQFETLALEQLDMLYRVAPQDDA